jgi:hypothetical protein
VASIDVGLSSLGNIVIIAVDDEGVRVAIPLTSDEAKNVAMGLLEGIARASTATPILLPDRRGNRGT